MTHFISMCVMGLFQLMMGIEEESKVTTSAEPRHFKVKKQNQAQNHDGAFLARASRSTIANALTQQ